MSAYFNHEYISNSDLKGLRKIINPKFEEPADLTEIFSFGTLVHALILEPHKADRTHKDYLLAHAMAKTVLTDPMCRNLLMSPDVRREHEFYRTNVYGIKARCKADAESKKLSLIFEFKGLSVASDKAFIEAIDRFDYDQAAAWYLDVTQRNNYLMVAGSKKDPRKLFRRYITRGHPIYNNGVPKVKKAVREFKEFFNI